MSIRVYFYKILRMTLVITALLGLGGIASYFAIFHWYVKEQLPTIQSFQEVETQSPLTIYSRDGLLLGEFGELRRFPIPIEEIPKPFIQAVLAAEDHRFYDHPGVDFISLVRATLNLIKTGEIQQGGSTLTMQVARNAILASRERTFERKFKEILLAWQLEKKWTKDEIMELYLNKTFLGHHAYGVGAAAYVYYGKKVNELSLAQYAMLAGLPKAPSANNPITNPERAKVRRDYILKRMYELDYITQASYTNAKETPITAELKPSPVQLEAHYVVEMVRAYMVETFGEAAYTKGYRVFTTIDGSLQKAADEALRTALFRYDERHGYRGAVDQIALTDDYRQLLKLYPKYGGLMPSVVLNVAPKVVKAYNPSVGSFDLSWQNVKWARPYLSDNKRGRAPKNAQQILKKGNIILVRTGGEQWRLAEVPQVQGALVALQPNDGAVLALAGGFDFFHSKFNRVTQAERQPGSAFKPFIYSAALEQGYTPASIINDAPFTLKVGRKVWQPHNYSGKFYGPTSLRKGLSHSRNLVAIRLLKSIGITYAVDHLAKFGFIAEKIPKNLTTALGTGEVTPWQIAKAYTVFANGGYLLEPYFIERIESTDSEIMCVANPLTICRENCLTDSNRLTITQAEVITTLEPLSVALDKEAEICTAPLAKPTANPRYATQVISARNAWVMTSLLKDVIQRGTARKARRLNRSDIAGKTGTTNDARDAWFVGYTPDIVTATWVGFDQPRSLGYRETGGKAALPMWIKFMETALKDKPVKNLPMPTGVTMARINPNSGLLTNSKNPQAKFETFYSETVPIQRETYAPKENRPTVKLSPNRQGRAVVSEQLF